MAGSAAESGIEESLWLCPIEDRRRLDSSREGVIDGRVVETVNQYGPGRDLPFDWSHRGLAPGLHKIRIRVLAEKPAASTDRFLNVAGLEIFTDTVP